MRHHWLARAGRAELTLVFAGWGLGPMPFAGLAGAGDVLVVDDYTALDDPLPQTAAYDGVRLLAYSFGVAAAGHWLSASGLRPVRLAAVNGTLFPADERKGIAPEIVTATADGLSTASFARFCRRAGHKGPVPAIDMAAAQAELRAIADRGPAPETRFDRVWISAQDRIVPASAQEAAWRDHAEAIRRIPASHQPFAPDQHWQEWFA
ncbi:DUF452 domain-containing protein [Maritimibacter sp. 55A14]|uniref:pimeloyl-ACP methyl esterase BioG family protein n=1 Tax=Maritimibacter sp. 55A14 TaxID=2174844 RepID=UPI000D61FDFC|nr:pimeloyl-ACP methyl esterase BioG family protein [Maritimibacter sp. 55A14]PWE32960.1 DUF452 domain-containing protein [Maritimibacter sp. 55A14]